MERNWEETNERIGRAKVIGFVGSTEAGQGDLDVGKSQHSSGSVGYCGVPMKEDSPWKGEHGSTS